jgi:cytochrome c
MRSLPLLLLVLAACGAEPPAEAPLTEAERLAMPASAASGQRLAQICRTCHEVGEGTGHRVGPNLWGVVGAEAARHGDFAYSRALERSGLVWDEAALHAYLANPQAVVPGGRMAYPGMPSEADRRDVIAYLRTLDGEAPSP